MPPESIKTIKKTKNIWFISKYCRLPSGALNYTDVFQVKGAYPARAFSILRCMAKQGYDCTLFIARHDYQFFGLNKPPSKEILFLDGIRIVVLNVIPYEKAQSLRRILGWIHFEIKLAFTKKDDIPAPNFIVASSLSLLSILNGLFFRWKKGGKLIFEVRDIWPLVLIEQGGYSKYNPFVFFLQLIEFIGYKYSDFIVSTLPNLKDHVKQIIGSSKAVHCIPMGIPAELINEESDLPTEISNLFPTDKFIVTYVGSIGIDNALETLVASARAMQSNDEIVFRVFGKGDLLDQYRSECVDLQNIVFEGSIPNSSVQSVLRRSSVLYFATHPTIVLNYGQSLNKLIDYMYSGRPILASHSGYRSMINESNCGYFVPAGDVNKLCDAIKRLAKLSRSDLDDIGSRGKSWLIENRTYTKLAKDYITILES